MGGALVLASVTAVLKNILENGLVQYGVTASLGSDAAISALPPDRVATGEDERAQINLFLYQVSPRGLYSSSRFGPEEAGAARPGAPRALDLLYLVTAYGAQDLHTEVLLGYVMEALGETPLLEGEGIRKALASVSSSDTGRAALPALAGVAASGVAARLEQIKISPQILNSEEMSKLWTSLQARFRPSAGYKVSVTLTDEPPPRGKAR